LSVHSATLLCQLQAKSAHSDAGLNAAVDSRSIVKALRTSGRCRFLSVNIGGFRGGRIGVTVLPLLVTKHAACASCDNKIRVAKTAAVNALTRTGAGTISLAPRSPALRTDPYRAPTSESPNGLRNLRLAEKPLHNAYAIMSPLTIPDVGLLFRSERRRHCEVACPRPKIVAFSTEVFARAVCSNCGYENALLRMTGKNDILILSGAASLCVHET
jgi:hypothetical protein